jgi:nitroimidazol reductase NimA-like FMN-containing flavoprotein (pyridoxamine 5'-phosphate oxidase superfamily)
MPHVTPVVYAMDGESLIVAIDYGTKKLANLKVNPQVSVVVDSYRPNGGVMIQGKCLIYERGPEYLRLQKILFERFEFYRKSPWKEGESPILKVVPSKVVSWGLK